MADKVGANKVGRREFIKGMGVVVAATAVPVGAVEAAGAPGAVQQGGGRPPAPAAEAPPPVQSRVQHPAEQALVFFTVPEAAFIGAAVDRLIPPDENGPGATDCGVVLYIDRQLAGAFGRGSGFYLAGPWSGESLPTQGYQLGLAPAELYRLAIAEIDKAARQANGGKAFSELDSGQQDNVLQSLDKGEMQLDTVPGKVFFDMLLANATEGYFADPAYGGNRDMGGWKMIGFPGARGGYAEAIVQYRNTPFGEVPVKLADLQ